MVILSPRRGRSGRPSIMAAMKDGDKSVDKMQEQFEALLKRIRVRNFEAEEGGSDRGEFEEVADTVCTSLRRWFNFPVFFLCSIFFGPFSP